VAAPYGRHRVEVLGSTPPGSRPPTYYDRPVLKPSEWGWLIATYFFVGGLAGAAQVIAGIVDLIGHHRDRALVSAARYLALGGSLLSPVLLIADLKTPARWYNMLRIYRSTSPMSIGSWTLLAFGSFSGLAALGHLADDVVGLRAGRRLARVAGIPAALAGAVLATYTGSILAATSTPLWAAGFRLLPPTFGTSGTATATAILALILERMGAPLSSRQRLERLGLLASLLELVLMLRLDSIWRHERVDGPLNEPPFRLPYRAGVFGAGILAPLGVHLLQALSGRELRRASMLASVAALAGGFTQRAVLVLAGKRSAERPTDYLHFTRP
jgi:formate-dependent nitrite reductase membrane component NrfD